MEPVDLIRQVVRRRLQGVVITEHHYLWKREEIQALRLEAEVGDDFLILSGQEVETDIGHVLVFGAKDTIKRGRHRLRELRRSFPAAALIWAHPFRSGNVPKEKELLNPMLDAVEIFSGNHNIKENCLGLSLWHKHKFTAIAGSDTHSEPLAGIFPTQFDHPVENIEDVVREIKKGRCRPFLKEIPKSGTNIRVAEIVIGTKGEDEHRNRIISKAIENQKDWDKEKKTSKITALLSGKGFDQDTFRVPKLIDINDNDRVVIEEGQRGKSLYELIINVNAATGMRYFKLAARWLARLHNLKLKITDTRESVKKENRRLDSYRKSFVKTGNPHTEAAGKLIDFVKEKEESIFSKRSKSLIQNHGDYHPKNIIIGQDKMHDISTLFISVIDFSNSQVMPASFDVAYFLSQFRNQFFAYPAIRKRFKESFFLKTYLKERKGIERDFANEVTLFRIRANLSIASYLIKVGKGESREMNALISDSGRLKSSYRASRG